ncbi:type II toxin-antitoxin system VapC family toxin [bacterium]|nr:type II toxin-antitoxin system VapC family toxin [bacterium]
MVDSKKICVDASLVLKLVIRESDSGVALRLWTEWIGQGMEITAPFLLAFETTSVIRNRVYRQDLTLEEGESAFEIIHSLDITFLNPDSLYKTAWELAKQFNRPAAYDSHYLALARILDCPLWTADKRLYNTVNNELTWVKWLGNLSL